MIGVISLVVLFMWGLFIFSIYRENEIFIFIASAGLIMVSVYIMVNGLEGVDNFVTKGLSVIQIGIGMMGLFAPLYQAINKED